MSQIEYIVEDLSSHPSCVHGPTLLLSRCVNEAGDRRKFYACSANREESGCFFLWENEEASVKKAVLDRQKRVDFPDVDHQRYHTNLLSIQDKAEDDRVYCYECSKLDIRNDKHKGHFLKIGLTDEELLRPSTWLKPLDNAKQEAQFLFSENATNDMMNILQNLDIKHVICIGAPRIHETIQNTQKKMTSLLLDLDHRYASFFGPSKFCWYNLFNNHFFTAHAKQIFNTFIQSDNYENMCIVMDPPFGGRLEPIAQTLSCLTKLYQSVNSTDTKLPVFLFFPYFMEPQILNSLPDYSMSDYQVDYDNHALFHNGKLGRKHGSPVRFFTNLSLSDIKLPDNGNYRFCKECDRWVYKDNQHCDMCDSCTSKDGKTYKHCFTCERCVKPAWKHCKKCNRCAHTGHKCGELPSFSQVCFHCNKRGHKKRDCPEVNHDELKRKRDMKFIKAKKMKTK